MPLNADHLLNRTFPAIETVVSDRDAMFYALSVGLGRDPTDEHDLRYVFEKALKPFPTLPIIFGHPGNWMAEDPATGITRSMVVHGAQRLEIFTPPTIGGTVVSTNRVAAIWDKGDKGAVMDLVRETHDKTTGTLIARGDSQVFCRADGGFGGLTGSGHDYRTVPDRSPDRTVTMPTDPNMALLYRLNHDRNPLHADPEVAIRAGFPAPILHGLATWGMAAVAVVRAFPERSLTAFEARFSKPVFPGDLVAIDLWEEPDGVAFRARVPARDVVALDRGWARF